jgi:hypothetical protein
MRVFQILDNDVLIIKDNEQYTDTAEHFKADSGLADLPAKVIYDDTQKQCLVDDDFKDYPNAEYDGYIDNVTAYIEAKAKRECVPPTLSELKAQALNIQYSKYLAKKEAPVTVDDLQFSTDEKSQREWQIALTLIEDKGPYKVRDSSNSLVLADVTKEQLMKSGKAARAQQLAAYEWFMSIRDAINNCKTADDLKTYLPPEKA